MTLNELGVGEKALITKVKGRGAFRKRILEMGFISGKEISVVKKAPLQDPVEYHILGYDVSLRNTEAQLIDIITETEIKELKSHEYTGTLDFSILEKIARSKGKTINIAFVGNPNSGKTTVFNHISGSSERVGNYSGVTVDAKKAKFTYKGYHFNAYDLPGTYSLTAYSPEELYVRQHIIDQVPDIIVNVLDSSNLERNLYLTTQLIDMDIRVVGALNMYDELEKKGDQLDTQLLSSILGIPFVPTVGAKNKGLNELLDKIISVFENNDPVSRHIHINYGKDIERSITNIQNKLRKKCNTNVLDKVSSRFISIKLLEKDEKINDRLLDLSNKERITHSAEREIERLESLLDEDTETILTDAKYGFIAGALHETFVPGIITKLSPSRKVDNLLTHRILGIPIFLFFMWLTFFFTFKVGQYPMDWIESGVSWISGFINAQMQAGIFKDLLVDGIIGGVGGVVVYLPNIVFLYLFISVMEDTGYMARAVFMMDRAMHKIGLHGKSFIPLLMGFGCNVPAILATRTIESKRDRLLTMLITPFMSCGARLPVYILFITAFFTSYQATILFGIYLTGIALAIITSLLLSKTILRKVDIPFVMELPPYRIPSAKTLLIHMWHSTEQYLKKIAGVILVASIIIWALGYFPREVDYSRDFDKDQETIILTYNNLIEQSEEKLKQEYSVELGIQLNELNMLKKNEHQEQSYIGQIGHYIQPIMAPLGFDWKMSVGILTGVAAKEVVIGSLGVLFQADEGDDANLISKLQNAHHTRGIKSGLPVFTPLIALTYMIFILSYFPCIGVVTAIGKESGSWGWAAFIMVYTTIVAWVLSFGVYQIGLLLTT
ncbi:MAG: ferrous iron transport protein B [Bacteroidales bacterium]|nr:ferrous iron transport protein B [Bacteroidales bacterium]